MKTKSKIGKVLLKDMSIYELSDKTGYSVPELSRWITGKVIPSIKVCMKLSDATNIPLREICELFVETTVFQKEK